MAGAHGPSLSARPSRVRTAHLCPRSWASYSHRKYICSSAFRPAAFVVKLIESVSRGPKLVPGNVVARNAISTCVPTAPISSHLGCMRRTRSRRWTSRWALAASRRGAGRRRRGILCFGGGGVAGVRSGRVHGPLGPRLVRRHECKSGFESVGIAWAGPDAL